jgi:F0F1-type ATP synthase assembly protein I
VKPRQNHNSKRYSFIQKFFIILSFIGVFTAGVGAGILIDKHVLTSHQHTENCSHKN